MKRIILYVMVPFLLAVTWQGPVSAQTYKSETRKGNKAFMEKGDYDAAIRHYQNALSADSLYIPAIQNMAYVLHSDRRDSTKNLGNDLLALKYLDKLARISAGTEHEFDCQFNRGVIFIDMKEWNGAIKAFRKCLILRPGDMDALENYVYAKKHLEKEQEKEQEQQNQQQEQQNKQQQDDKNSSLTSGSKPGDKSGGKPENKPGDKSDDKSGDKSGDKSDGKPGDKPGDKSEDKPGNKPGDKSGDKSGDKPDGKQGDQPDDRSNDKSGGKQGDQPDDRSNDKSNGKSGGKPENKPENKPDDRSNDTSNGKSGGNPGDNPGADGGSKETQPKKTKITPQAAQQILQAMREKEKETLRKVNKKKAEGVKAEQKTKNW